MPDQPTREKIVKLHNMINMLVHGDVPEISDHIGAAVLDGLTYQRDVLCWILGHDNQIFADNMEAIENRLNALGYVYDDSPDAPDTPFGSNGHVKA